MSSTYSNTDSDLLRLNAWLCGKVHSCNSMEALHGVAMDHDAYQQDPVAGTLVVAKVWCDTQNGKVKPRAYISTFERHSLLQMDFVNGAKAAVLLMELRSRWPGKAFPITTTSAHKILPGMSRHHCEKARDLLIEAGMIRKERNFRKDQHGDHEAALYQLCPVREVGELAEVEKKPRASKAHTSQERASEPPSATEQTSAPETAAPERPPTSTPEAKETTRVLLVPKTQGERAHIEWWTKVWGPLTAEDISDKVDRFRRGKADEAEAAKPDAKPATEARQPKPGDEDYVPSPDEDYVMTPDERRQYEEMKPHEQSSAISKWMWDRIERERKRVWEAEALAEKEAERVACEGLSPADTELVASANQQRKKRRDPLLLTREKVKEYVDFHHYCNSPMETPAPAKFAYAEASLSAAGQ